MKQEDFNKIERYLNGIADESEVRYVESLFRNGECNPDLRNSLMEEWDSILTEKTSSSVDLNKLLNRIHSKIGKDEEIRKRKALRKILSIYTRVAAILLLPVMIAGGLVFNILAKKPAIESDKIVTATIIAPMGARVSFNLPDGTTGMLNSGSHLSYSLPFNDKRQIKLEGEAWFEVKSDKEHPFEIDACGSTVRALGTSFNLSAYKDENYAEVVLQEGKIEFSHGEETNKVIILPSERLVYQEGKITTLNVDHEKFNAWTHGMLVFRGDPMSEVVRRIERWYNVKIEIRDRELEKYSFRATFQDDSLDDVLKYLAMTSPISYTIIPRAIMTDGTFTKERVILRKKFNN